MLPVRRRGLAFPLSAAQLVAIWAYVLTSALFFIIAQAHALPAWALGSIGALCFVVVACFLFVSLVDPMQDPTPLEARLLGPLRCFDPATSTSRFVRDATYCSWCRKMVPGMDHHCPWLNTCVGSRNYALFYALSVATTLQFAGQCVAGALVAATRHQRPPVAAALLWGHNALAVILFGLLGSLFLFHSLLIHRNVSTMDMILEYRSGTLRLGSTIKVAPTNDPI